MAGRKPRSLVYQVFVDRFAGPQGAALTDPPTGADPWRHHCGGTLDGVARRLDHITGLGADAIWLTPIFSAPSNHKYDGASFEEVDRRFGGEAAFRDLAYECRRRGMGLILDGVFNHVGKEHPWFREARESPRSPRARFFRFHREPREGPEYDRWRGMGWLPELAHQDPKVRAALAEVVRRWSKRGVTGWRLDCANDLGVELCRILARAGQEAGARDGAIGELMSFADLPLQEGLLTGAMNYWLRQTVLGLVTGEVPAVQAAANLESMIRRYPREGLLRSWSLLASHDTPRLATLVREPERRALARLLTFTLPGTPCLYYGEEVGMEGGPDPDNRRPMVWEEARWDREALAQVKRLAGWRREREALTRGDYLPLPLPAFPGVLGYARVTDRPEETVLVLANAGNSPAEGRFFAPLAHLHDALPLADLAGTTAGTRMESGSFLLSVPPWSAAVLVPQDGTIPGYRFFKPAGPRRPR